MYHFKLTQSKIAKPLSFICVLSVGLLISSASIAANTSNSSGNAKFLPLCGDKIRYVIVRIGPPSMVAQTTLVEVWPGNPVTIPVVAGSAFQASCGLIPTNIDTSNNLGWNLIVLE